MINEHELITKLSTVSKSIKDQLKKKGVVVPVKTKRGISLDDYAITKKVTGYTVENKYGDAVYENLYYVQTAVVLANSLALKKAIRPDLVLDDAKAGANEFDLMLYKHRLKSAINKQDEFKMGHYQTRAIESDLLYKKHFTSINSAYQSIMNAIKAPR
jgi:hypothetical protein